LALPSQTRLRKKSSDEAIEFDSMPLVYIFDLHWQRLTLPIVTGFSENSFFGGVSPALKLRRSEARGGENFRHKNSRNAGFLLLFTY